MDQFVKACSLDFFLKIILTVVPREWASISSLTHVTFHSLVSKFPSWFYPILPCYSLSNTPNTSQTVFITTFCKMNFPLLITS